jgi:hypothetical protein
MLMVSTWVHNTFTCHWSLNNSPAGAVNVIDFYLDSAREKERLQVIKLAQTDDKQSVELLRGYVREAMSAYD